MENLYNALYLLSPIDGVSSSEELTTGEFKDWVDLTSIFFTQGKA
jgi:hypothetical protein